MSLSWSIDISALTRFPIAHVGYSLGKGYIKIHEFCLQILLLVPHLREGYLWGPIWDQLGSFINFLLDTHTIMALFGIPLYI
jgi:hypothetical protein